jgi:HAD superfamily hydrolase (TIGR01549 family)
MIDQRPVTAVIWDYDGTLVDTRAKNWGITRQLVRSFTGVDPDTIEGLRSLDGYTSALHRHHNWRSLYVGEFGMSEEMTTDAGRRWTEFHLEDATAAPVYEGIDGVLAQLATLPHGIVSANSRDNIRRSLADRGLLEHFQIVIGYEEVPAERQKPAPDGLILCLEALTGLAAGHVVYVGDHQIDIECARNATAALRARGHDITVFAVGAAYGIGAELGAWADDPDYAIASPAELVALLHG